MTSTICSNCQAVIEQTYEFCPNCGTRRVIEKSTKETISDRADIKPTEKAKTISVESSGTSKEKYSSGAKTTFIWSSVLSLITLSIYALKGKTVILTSDGLIAGNTIDVITQTLLQGLVVRPLIVLIIAFIISVFYKSDEKKIKKYNSVCTTGMALITAYDVIVWFIIVTS